MSALSIRHDTTYRHTAPAAGAWQAIRLMPREETAQECLAFDLEITPHPGDVIRRADYFGNTAHLFHVREQHTELAISARSVVRRREAHLPMSGLTPTIEAAVPALQDLIAGGEFTLEQYRHPSRFVPDLPAGRELCSDLDSEHTPLLEWIAALGRCISRDFTFDARATSLSTPVEEVLRTRRGVCQDFAHLFIACARQFGLSAAYVSGYILTAPPPGRSRLLGADAMHAWTSIYVPGTGWIDYDPTNGCFAGTGHIVIARGRDYADVSPIRGIFTGGGQHTLHLGVTVEPEEEESVQPPAPGKRP